VLSLSLPAVAGVTVNSPSNNSDVSTSFKLNASAATCSSKSVTAMGYSFDSSSDTTEISNQSIDRNISASTGTHTLHVKAWSAGHSCVTDVIVNVKAVSASADEVPSDAATVSNIETMSDWSAHHDTAGSGDASGATDVVSTPSKYGSARRFVTKFKNNGDERYSRNFSDDVESKNFFYDAWVYLNSTADHLANLEMDVNQVMANGKTVLVGMQCDGWTGNWAYTVNTGSASNVKPKWVSKSGTSCNPRSWTRDAWHHVQFSFSRDDSGNIQYKSVWLDGKKTAINESAFGAADLGWDPTIKTQFQVDGYGSDNSVTVFLDKLTISRW
jgi:hypothetical protein